MLALGLAVAMLAAFAIPRLLEWWKVSSKLKDIPGPTLVPVIGGMLELWKHNYDFLKLVEQWTKKYSPIFSVKVGLQNCVFLSKPEDLEILLSSTTQITKSSRYNTFTEWTGNGLVSSTGHKWRLRRKLITPTFHFSVLEQYVDVFNRNTDILVSKLLSEDMKDKAMDVNELIHLCSLDVICETSMGTSVNAQKNSDSSYVRSISQALIAIHNRAMKMWLRIDFIFNYLSPYGRLYKSAVKVMKSHAQRVIDRKRSERSMQMKNRTTEVDNVIEPNKRATFLDKMLEESDSMGLNITDDGIQEEVQTFMSAGHETSAATSSLVLYELAANPQVKEIVLEELRDIFNGSDRHCTYQDLRSMKYLERVVKETLRLYTLVPVYSRSTVADLHLTDGVVIPKGVDVAVNARMLHRNPKYWPEPEKFDPDRFLLENVASRHPFSYLPFSAGPRNCIGQKFALLEVQDIVSSVLRRCDVNLPYPGYEPEVRGAMVLRFPEGIMLRVSPWPARSAPRPEM